MQSNKFKYLRPVVEALLGSVEETVSKWENRLTPELESQDESCKVSIQYSRGSLSKATFFLYGKKVAEVDRLKRLIFILDESVFIIKDGLSETRDQLLKLFLELGVPKFRLISIFHWLPDKNLSACLEKIKEINSSLIESSNERIKKEYREKINQLVLDSFDYIDKKTKVNKFEEENPYTFKKLIDLKNLILLNDRYENVVDLVFSDEKK